MVSALWYTYFDKSVRMANRVTSQCWFKFWKWVRVDPGQSLARICHAVRVLSSRHRQSRLAFCTSAAWAGSQGLGHGFGQLELQGLFLLLRPPRPQRGYLNRFHWPFLWGMRSPCKELAKAHAELDHPVSYHNEDGRKKSKRNDWDLLTGFVNHLVPPYSYQPRCPPQDVVHNTP